LIGDLAVPCEEWRSGVGQRDAALGPVKDLHAALRHVLADGRFGHVQPVRGAAEMELLCDCDVVSGGDVP
jgi:hypothetical protein